MSKAKFNRAVRILKIANNGRLGQIEKALLVEVIRKAV